MAYSASQVDETLFASVRLHTLEAAHAVRASCMGAQGRHICGGNVAAPPLQNKDSRRSAALGSAGVIISQSELARIRVRAEAVW